MGQRLSYWIFLGAIGFAAFLLLHDSIAFNAGAPLGNSKSTIERETANLASELGFSTDTLNMLVTRSQHLDYYRQLEDSLGKDLPPPVELNKRGVNLSGWQVVLGSVLSGEDIFTFTSQEIFNKVGRVKLLFDDSGKIRRLNTHPANPNPLFVAGDSLSAIADHLVSEIFGYDLSDYRLSSVDVSDTLIASNEPGLDRRPLRSIFDGEDTNTVFEFNWRKKK